MDINISNIKDLLNKQNHEIDIKFKGYKHKMFVACRSGDKFVSCWHYSKSKKKIYPNKCEFKYKRKYSVTTPENIMERVEIKFGKEKYQIVEFHTDLKSTDKIDIICLSCGLIFNKRLFSFLDLNRYDGCPKCKSHRKKLKHKFK
jgi:hypothetical protein